MKEIEAVFEQRLEKVFNARTLKFQSFLTIFLKFKIKDIQGTKILTQKEIPVTTCNIFI